MKSDTLSNVQSLSSTTTKNGKGYNLPKKGSLPFTVYSFEKMQLNEASYESEDYAPSLALLMTSYAPLTKISFNSGTQD